MPATAHHTHEPDAAGFAVMGQPGPGQQPLRAAGSVQVPPLRTSPSGPVGPAPQGAGRPAWTEEHVLSLREQHQRARMWAAIRSEVAHRLVGMNVRHALHAWNERRGRPVAAWAVAFLYAHPSGTVYDGVALHTVMAACRMVDHDPDLPGPAHLLNRLVAIGDARHRDQNGWFDPLTICTTRDTVDQPATYIGVGLSCLGNRTQPWERLRKGDSDDISGHCYALLTDHTALLLTRAPRAELSRVVVHGTGDLSFQHDVARRRWITHSDVTSMPETDIDVWDQLNDLHLLAGHQAPLPTLAPEPTVRDRA